MRRDQRLRSSRRFSQIRSEGRVWVNNHLVLRTLANSDAETRFGFIATRRIGNAVVRNRLRRRLREILRVAPVKTGWDLVFIVRKRSVDASFQKLERSVNNLLRRSNLLESSPRSIGPRC